MESDSETCGREHRQVVGSVAHSDGLRNVYILHLRYEFEQLGFATPVDDFAHIVSGEFAVFNLKFVGVHIIEAEFLLEVATEIGETTRKNCGFVSGALEHFHHSVNTLGDRQVFGDIFHHALIETLEQSHTLLETLVEVDFAAHSALGDGFHLVAHSGAHCEFVDNLGFDERGVHIEADEAAATAVHVVLLHRDIKLHLGSHLHEVALHLFLIERVAAHRKFHARLGQRLLLVGEGHTSREALNAVDVHPLLCHHIRHLCHLLGSEFTSEDGDDISVFPLHTHPLGVVFHRDRGEANLHIQFVSLEEQLLEDFARALAVGFEQDTEGEVVVDVCLTDIENLCIIFSKYFGERRGYTRSVLTGDVDEDKFEFGCLFSHNQVDNLVLHWINKNCNYKISDKSQKFSHFRHFFAFLGSAPACIYQNRAPQREKTCAIHHQDRRLSADVQRKSGRGVARGVPSARSWGGHLATLHNCVSAGLCSGTPPRGFQPMQPSHCGGLEPSPCGVRRAISSLRGSDDDRRRAFPPPRQAVAAVRNPVFRHAGSWRHAGRAKSLDLNRTPEVVRGCASAVVRYVSSCVPHGCVV